MTRVVVIEFATVQAARCATCASCPGSNWITSEAGRITTKQNLADVLVGVAAGVEEGAGRMSHDGAVFADLAVDHGKAGGGGHGITLERNPDAYTVLRPGPTTRPVAA